MGKIGLICIVAFVSGCATMDASQCNPTTMNQMDYYRCGNKGVDEYVKIQQSELDSIRYSEQLLRADLASYQSKESKIRKQFYLLNRQKLQLEAEIKHLQVIAKNASNLPKYNQKNLAIKIGDKLIRYADNLDELTRKTQNQLRRAGNSQMPSRHSSRNNSNLMRDIYDVYSAARDIKDVHDEIKKNRKKSEKARRKGKLIKKIARKGSLKAVFGLNPWGRIVSILADILL